MKADVIRSLNRPARDFAAVYGMILVVLAIVPHAEAAGVGVSDWVLHSIAYGIFGGLLLASGFGAGAAVGGAAGLGFGTEIIQLLIPYRSFEFLDVVADTVGALIIVFLGMFVFEVSRPSRQEKR